MLPTYIYKTMLKNIKCQVFSVQIRECYNAIMFITCLYNKKRTCSYNHHQSQHKLISNTKYDLRYFSSNPFAVSVSPPPISRKHHFQRKCGSAQVTKNRYPHIYSKYFYVLIVEVLFSSFVIGVNLTVSQIHGQFLFSARFAFIIFCRHERRLR